MMTDDSSSGLIEAIPNSDPEDESNRRNGHLCEHVTESASSVAMQQRVFKLRRGPPSKFQGEAVVASTYGEAASVLRLRKKLRLRLRRKKQQQQQQHQHQSPAETTQLIRKLTQTETLTSLTPTTETPPTPMETPAETHETSSPSPTRMSKTASDPPLPPLPPPPPPPPASFSTRLSSWTGTMTTAKNIHVDPTAPTTTPAVVHACEGCARIGGDSNCTMQSMTNDILQPDTNCSCYDEDRRLFNIELCQSSVNPCQSAVNQPQSTSDQCQSTSDQRQSTSDQCQSTSDQRQSTSDQRQSTSDQCQSTFDQCQSTSDQSQSTFNQCQSTFNQCWQSISNRHQPTVTSGDEGQESEDCETHWVCLPVGDADKACPMTSLSKVPQATDVAVNGAVKIPMPLSNQLDVQMPAAHVWSRIRTEDSSSESSSCVSSSTCSTMDETISSEEGRYEDIQALRAAAVALFAAQKQLEECANNGNCSGSSSSSSSSSSSRIGCVDSYIESAQDYTDDAVGNSEMNSYQDGINCNDNDDGGFSVVDNGDPYCSSDMGYASNPRKDDHKRRNASQRVVFY